MKFPIKVVYVAGLISKNKKGEPATKEEREQNIEDGRKAGAAVWKMGAMPIVPHLNSLGMHEAENISAESIYLGDLALVERCDAVLRLEGWNYSVGCQYETAWAEHHRIPIFDTLGDLERWLNS